MWISWDTYSMHFNDKLHLTTYRCPWSPLSWKAKLCINFVLYITLLIAAIVDSSRSCGTVYTHILLELFSVLTNTFLFYKKIKMSLSVYNILSTLPSLFIVWHQHGQQKIGTWFTRSSLIHFACIGVAPTQLVLQRDQPRGSNSKTIKWIKIDLLVHHVSHKPTKEHWHGKPCLSMGWHGLPDIPKHLKATWKTSAESFKIHK